MIANLIATLFAVLPANTVAPTDNPTQNTVVTTTEVAPVMLYVWAHNPYDLHAAVAFARANGFVPTSAPMFLSYVPEAWGPAWVVYVRPAY